MLNLITSMLFMVRFKLMGSFVKSREAEMVLLAPTGGENHAAQYDLRIDGRPGSVTFLSGRIDGLTPPPLWRWVFHILRAEEFFPT